MLCAIKQLKTGKNDGSLGFASDHFINACDKFRPNIHVAMLFSVLLVHGVTPDDLVSGTLIPIPKGKNVNVTDSSTYRAIALSSVFGKVFDLICLHKFYMCSCTTEQQFGFKRRHSTDINGIKGNTIVLHC